MKTLNLVQSLAVGGLMVLIAGCSSTPKATDAKVSAVFQQPIEKAQKAAVDALTLTGLAVKKQEPTYVEGTRPRKIGVFVGSGGETVGVWLTAQSVDRTEVKVKTAKTFVGGAGQKNWDAEVMAEITKKLNK